MVHVISGFPGYKSSRYDSIQYSQYQFRYDTDPITVRSLNATARNVQAFTATGITVSWLLLLTTGVLPGTFMKLRYPGAQFTVRVPVRQGVPGRPAYCRDQGHQQVLSGHAASYMAEDCCFVTNTHPRRLHTVDTCMRLVRRMQTNLGDRAFSAAGLHLLKFGSINPLGLRQLDLSYGNFRH